MKRKYRPLLKAISAVLGNLSAAWFALAFITPNFVDVTKFNSLIVLTRDILLGIVFLVLTTIVERYLQDE